MQKAKKYNVAETNIALFGSDVEKNIKLHAAQSENAWSNAGKSIGIQVWRIENFKVVAQPKDQFGTFYDGDSYIVLRTYKAKPEDQKFQFDAHFWLGQNTSQDEAGTSAYKTVELDDVLGGAPVQHREVGGYESELFLSYFPKFQVVSGGVATGFKHVKPEEYKPRLLQVRLAKKSHAVVIRQVDLSSAAMNSGDVFVLDHGLTIYQWNGSKSSAQERVKAAEFCRALDDERKGLAKVIVLAETDTTDAAPFFAIVGKQTDVKADAPDAEPSQESVKRLLKISNASGPLQMTEVATKIVRASQFDTKDCFVYDDGKEVFVWIGKQADSAEKKAGLQYAQDYLVKYKRPPTTPISRVLQGGENEVFQDSLDPEAGQTKNLKFVKGPAQVVPGVQHR